MTPNDIQVIQSQVSKLIEREGALPIESIMQHLKSDAPTFVYDLDDPLLIEDSQALTELLNRAGFQCRENGVYAL